MTPGGAELQTVEEIYALLLKAAHGKRPVTAFYDDLPRLLCPHVLGQSRQGRPHAFCFQSGGGSARGLRSGPEGVGDWRCIAVEKLSQVVLTTEVWRSEPRAGRQHCVEKIEFDIDAQPGDDPQKGQ
jgi:hypothetical protein